MAIGVVLVVAAIVPCVLIAALFGAARLRPASIEMQAEIRYSGTFGPTAGRRVWSTLSNEVMQSPFYLAEAETDLRAPVAALAALPDASELTTGSLGLPKLVTPEKFQRPGGNPRLDADRAPPRAKQQPKPQLAALSPAEIGIKPPEEEAPRKTAYYDITAKIVYMPDGERLEAHSGLGRYMDDPRYYKVRMRGVTPPNTYRLKMRESLFHGVRAIRLLPEDKAAMNGRDGILAHSYMLGPSGQSNGCVSFKHYDKFLQAFLRGEVERMVVVFKMDKPPVFARRPMKSAQYTESNTN